MEDEKKKRKNKKKKNKQTKSIENNAVGLEESASSNQNHAAEIRSTDAHTDDTSGVDEDRNTHVTDGSKVAIFEEQIKQLQKDNEAHMQNESNLEERIKQLQNEINNHRHKEASFEEKIIQSQKEISSLTRQEASQEEKIRLLQAEKDVHLQKEVGLEERINQLVAEVDNLNSVKVSLEEKVKEMEKERVDWLQKEKSFREIISSMSGDNALLEAQVKELEELRTTIVQENQMLKENAQSLQTQIHNLEKSAALPYSTPTGSKMNTLENGEVNSELEATRVMVDKLVSENAELVEKVNKLYVELEQRGSAVEVSSSLSSEIIATSSEATRVPNESANRSIPSAVQQHELNQATDLKSKSNNAVVQSGEKLLSLEDVTNKAEIRDHDHVAKMDRSVINSSGIEPDEIVQIPLDENEVQSTDLEAANVDQVEEEVPLTSAPLIGAPFRLISFFARYVSGADLVNKN